MRQITKVMMRLKNLFMRDRVNATPIFWVIWGTGTGRGLPRDELKTIPMAHETKVNHFKLRLIPVTLWTKAVSILRQNILLLPRSKDKKRLWLSSIRRTRLERPTHQFQEQGSKISASLRARSNWTAFWGFRRTAWMPAPSHIGLKLRLNPIYSSLNPVVK